MLQKDHLQMCKVDEPATTANYYKNGAITQGGLGGLLQGDECPEQVRRSRRCRSRGCCRRRRGTAGDMREFVAGEKFFVTSISTGHDGVVFA